jgi:hypothetical protein
MSDIGKTLLFHAVATIALFIVVYSGGAALLIAGVLLLPWLLAKIACGLVLVTLVTRVIAAYYAARQL